jgi:hypothetical protein
VADPNAKLYRDAALMPVAEEDAEHMDLYTQNDAARVAVARERRVAGKSRAFVPPIVLAKTAPLRATARVQQRKGRDSGQPDQRSDQREGLGPKLTRFLRATRATFASSDVGASAKEGSYAWVSLRGANHRVRRKMPLQDNCGND